MPGLIPKGDDKSTSSIEKIEENEAAFISIQEVIREDASIEEVGEELAWRLTDHDYEVFCENLLMGT